MREECLVCREVWISDITEAVTSDTSEGTQTHWHPSTQAKHGPFHLAACFTRGCLSQRDPPKAWSKVSSCPHPCVLLFRCSTPR